MFLAVLRIPDVPDFDARAAQATGLARVDARRRLAGLLPRVLIASADRDVVDRAAVALEADGFGPFIFDPRSSPTDDERSVPRTLELGPDGFVCVTGVGTETRTLVPWNGVELIQRGSRKSTHRETVTTKTRKLAVGRTLLAGGIPITKKVEKTETHIREADEPFLLLHRRDGGDDLILYERRLDYGFLGAERQTTSHANLERTLALLASRTGAAVSDRISRAPFVAGIPECGTDPIDVAAHLGHLAWRLGA